MIREGKAKVGDGKDVDHIKPLSKGGANRESNAREISPHLNRSYPRTKTSQMKHQNSRLKRK